MEIGEYSKKEMPGNVFSVKVLHTFSQKIGDINIFMLILFNIL